MFWIGMFFHSYLTACVLATQSCMTLCNSMDCSPPVSSVHGILQASRLEWVVIPFSRRSSWHKDQTQVFCTAGRFFTVWTIREAHLTAYLHLISSFLEISLNLLSVTCSSFYSVWLHCFSFNFRIYFLVFCLIILIWFQKKKLHMLSLPSYPTKLSGMNAECCCCCC